MGNGAEMLPASEPVVSHAVDSNGPQSNSSSTSLSSFFDIPLLQDANVSVLPPCRICGEKASGFHYGANTCEACKGFFRRSLRKKEKYKCVGRGRCEIRSSKRSLCGACRYRKCLAVGMSKEAIKTGRYTHEKKTRDVEEVRRIVQQKLRAQAAAAALTESTTASLVTSMRPIRVISVEEIEKIVHSITEAHLIHTRYILEKLPEKEREFMEQRALQEKYFGTLKPLPIEEYMKIYEITGIDVDGRRGLIEGFIPYVESCIRRFIAFAKAIPGFKELLTEDQIAIIKASRFEAWMILCHHHFNHKLHLYTTVYGKVLCYEEMIQLHNADYIDLMFVAQERIRGLKLDYEETCILGAFTMMFTDRCRLHNPSSTEDVQDLLLTCLSYWFKKSRPEEPMIFAKIIDVLVQLRMVRHLHSKEEEKFAMRWSNKIQIPPLMYEMWSS